MSFKKIPSQYVETGIAATGMCLFGLFIIYKHPPFIFIAIFGLLIVTIAIQFFFRKEPHPFTIFGLSPISKKILVFVFIGSIIGAGLGVIYRVNRGKDLLPDALRRFALISALIGATEELLYRGYIQGRTQSLGPMRALLFAAICHTGYKYALFAFLPQPVTIDYGFIIFWTFLGGILFGVFRRCSGSVLMPLASHASFDIIVYGEYSNALWWVWS